jgi:hypothetical protein
VKSVRWAVGAVEKALKAAADFSEEAIQRSEALMTSSTKAWHLVSLCGLAELAFCMRSSHESEHSHAH